MYTFSKWRNIVVSNVGLHGDTNIRKTRRHRWSSKLETAGHELGIESCGKAHESTMWKVGAYHRSISTICSRWLASSEMGYHQSFWIMGLAKELGIGDKGVRRFDGMIDYAA